MMYYLHDVSYVIQHYCYQHEYEVYGIIARCLLF